MQREESSPLGLTSYTSLSKGDFWRPHTRRPLKRTSREECRDAGLQTKELPRFLSLSHAFWEPLSNKSKKEYSSKYSGWLQFSFQDFFHETALAFASLSAFLRAVNSSPYSFSAGSSSLSPDPPTRLRLILPWERKTFLSHGKPFCGWLDRTVPTASTSSTPRPLCLRGTILA